MKRTVPRQPSPAARRKTEDDLDQALANSFPASDPVSIIEPSTLEPSRKSSKPAGKKKPKRAP